MILPLLYSEKIPTRISIRLLRTKPMRSVVCFPVSFTGSWDGFPDKKILPPPPAERVRVYSATIFRAVSRPDGIRSFPSTGPSRALRMTYTTDCGASSEAGFVNLTVSCPAGQILSGRTGLRILFQQKIILHMYPWWRENASLSPNPCTLCNFPEEKNIFKAEIKIPG